MSARCSVYRMVERVHKSSKTWETYNHYRNYPKIEHLRSRRNDKRCRSSLQSNLHQHYLFQSLELFGSFKLRSTGVMSWVRYPVWQHTFVSPSAFSRRAVVSYWRKYVHEVLVNRLGGLSLPRKSVARLTDRPDMTLDVYRGRKTTIQQQQQVLFKRS